MTEKEYQKKLVQRARAVKKLGDSLARMKVGKFFRDRGESRDLLKNLLYSIRKQQEKVRVLSTEIQIHLGGLNGKKKVQSKKEAVGGTSEVS